MHESLTMICDPSSGCDHDALMQANLLAAQACTVLLSPLQMSGPQLCMPTPQLGQTLEQSNNRSELPHKVLHLATFSSLRRASAVLSVSLARFCSRYLCSMQSVRRHIPSPCPARLPLARPLLGSPQPGMQAQPCYKPGSLQLAMVLMCCSVLGSPQLAMAPIRCPQQGSLGMAMLLMRYPVLHSPRLAMLPMRCPVLSCPQLTMPLKSRLKLQNIMVLQSLRDLIGMAEGQRRPMCHQVRCRQRSIGNTLKRPGSTTCRICSTLTGRLRLMPEHTLRSSMQRR